MINYWLSEIYLDEQENCYKPLGWDLIEGKGYANVKHSVSFYKQKSKQKVILETDVSEDIEQQLRDLGLKELTRNISKLKYKNTIESKKIPLKDRKILDSLE